MRIKVIAGNWKMNTNLAEATELAKQIKTLAGTKKNIDIILCPPFTNLQAVGEAIKGSNIKLGAQNLYFEVKGAFTGEISADMLKSVGCKYVIIGHSERRTFFGETDESVNKKVKFALHNDLVPIVCVGETLEEREAEVTFEVIGKQIKNGLAHLNTEVVEQNKEIIIAYEPVWAIGTGKVASPAQAQEVHAFIRAELVKIFNAKKAEELRIQYGGSVKPDNVKELMSQKDIDGALVGGASLKADSFCALLNI